MVDEFDVFQDKFSHTSQGFNFRFKYMYHHYHKSLLLEHHDTLLILDSILGRLRLVELLRIDRKETDSYCICETGARNYCKKSFGSPDSDTAWNSLRSSLVMYLPEGTDIRVFPSIEGTGVSYTKLMM
ncbi:hypothetical protein TNCV_3680521 [Trichonephila clavipes]|nr:hypothetical protein TNCV_3680521 [Trichonephila clavipes]